jgi:hypothetical protein
VANSRVLVVYGYHPRETYAFDVGLRLAKDPNRKLLVKRYSGKVDRASIFSADYERNLHMFIRQFAVPYVIVLHNSDPDYPRDYNEYRRKHPEIKFDKIKWPTFELYYDSRRKIPGALDQKLREVCSEYFAKDFRLHVRDEFKVAPDCMPEGIDELSVEFLHYRRISKTRALGVVKSLAAILSEGSGK